MNQPYWIEKLLRTYPVRSLFIPCCFVVTGLANAGDVTAPPQAEIERLELDTSFYKKYLSVNGFPVVASYKVSDFALKEAEFLILQMVGDRPDLLEALTDAKIRFSIMAPDEFTTAIPEHSSLTPKNYWDKRARGLGSTPERPAVSCGEENLLGYVGDPYAKENIFIHEFAHSIHQQGLKKTDPTFQKRLENSFQRAVLKGFWKGKYAGTNPAEYWAEGVQSWFDTNREDDHDHNHVNTREELKAHDKGLAALCEEVFGDGVWRYQRPPEREKGAPHLVGYDPKTAPTFAWPTELVAAYAALEKGEGLKSVASLNLKNLNNHSFASPPGGEGVQLKFQNQTSETMRLFWVTFEGKRRAHGHIDPNRSTTQGTYEGHFWVVVDENNEDIALVAAPNEDGVFVIK